MNVGNNPFINISPSIRNTAGSITTNFIFPQRADPTSVDIAAGASEEVNCHGKAGDSLHASMASVPPPSASLMGAHLEETTACRVNDAKRVTWNARSVTSFVNDSNASYKKGGIPFSTCSENHSTPAKFLHRACQLFPNSPEIICSALFADQGAIHRREKLVMTTTSGLKRARQRRSCIFEPYTLPINIAIKRKASLDVLRILVNAGMDTIELRDGYEKSTSLIIALKMRASDVATIDLLLNSNARSAMVSDRHHNYPLHIACSRGSSLDVVELLYSVFPRALSMKNFNGETPLDIAQRRSLCSEDVLNFLQSKAFK